jgi:putative membrane protein
MTRPGDGHESPHDRHGDQAAGSAPSADGGAGPGPAEPDPPETEPDPRFTLANERTFLAWSRTALALVAAGLGIVQLLPPFPGVPLGRHVVGVPLIVLGAVIAVAAYGDMMRNQRALRRQQPLPRSVLPRLLAGAIGGVATVAAVVVLLSATR